MVIIIKLFSALIGVLLFGCKLNLDPQIEESYRVTSPDGVYFAVLARYNFHATTGFSYRVSLFDTRNPFNVEEGVDILITDSVEGTQISWLNSETLLIRCLVGTVYSWQNRVDFETNSIRVEVDSICKR